MPGPAALLPPRGGLRALRLRPSPGRGEERQGRRAILCQAPPPRRGLLPPGPAAAFPGERGAGAAREGPGPGVGLGAAGPGRGLRLRLARGRGAEGEGGAGPQRGCWGCSQHGPGGRGGVGPPCACVFIFLGAVGSGVTSKPTLRIHLIFKYLNSYLFLFISCVSQTPYRKAYPLPELTKLQCAFSI